MVLRAASSNLPFRYTPTSGTRAHPATFWGGNDVAARASKDVWAPAWDPRLKKKKKKKIMKSVFPELHVST